MSVPLELLDRYLTTFVDFWRLRPRRFLKARTNNRQKYAPPGQFLGVSVLLLTILLVIGNTLITEDQKVIIGGTPAAPEALAGRMVVFVVTLLGVNSVLYRALAPWWPIKANVTLTQIVTFQCYMTCTLVPMAAFDVLFSPIMFWLVARGSDAQLLLIPSAIGGVAGVPLFFLYQNPGIAYLCRVSSSRMFFGTAILSLSVGIIVGLIIGVIAVAIMLTAS